MNCSEYNIAMDISILIPTKHSADKIRPRLENLEKTCSRHDKVELLFKVDSIKHKNELNKLLSASSFEYKILYNTMTGYSNMHLYFRDLAALSRGCLLFPLSDNANVKGDWHSAFMNSRDKVSKNIYVLNTRSYARWTLFPVLSREWYEALGYISPAPPIDSWLRNVAEYIDRYIDCPGVTIEYEPGHTSNMVPKKIRKEWNRTISNFHGAGNILMSKINENYDEKQ